MPNFGTLMIQKENKGFCCNRGLVSHVSTSEPRFASAAPEPW